MTKHKILDLFSGLGGFSLGLESTGHFETVAFCDNNKYSKLILDKHWKGVKIYDDVREISKEKFREDGIEFPDIITGWLSVSAVLASRANKKERVTTDISGQRCFALSKHSNRGTLLARMSEELLTSKTAWSSRLCALTWKAKDTKFNRSLFQLQASVLPIGEKESGLLPTEKNLWSTPTTFDSNNIQQPRKNHPGGGQVPPLNQQVMWATPNTMDHLPPRSEEGTRKLMEGQRKGRTSPSNLREQVDPKTMQLWRTPTTMDSKEDSLKHATKLLQGKNLRSTGARIQITLADEVMVEEIKANPELMEQYKDYEMVTRKNLPEQQEFVDYMREQTTVAALFEKTGIKRTTIEHWFRRDKAGFSHPSIEDWEKIKPHLTTVKYDKEMTTLHSIEWKEETKIMWPTPTTKGFGHASEGQTMIMRRKVEAGELTEPEAQAMLNGTTLRPPRLKKWMWPTPRASGQENPESLINAREARAASSTQLDGSSKNDADTNDKRLEGFRKSSQEEFQQKINLTSEGSDRRQGSVGQGWWSVEPNVGRVAHGVPGRVHRLKGLGNSIVPQIVEEIGYALIKAERSK